MCTILNVQVVGIRRDTLQLHTFTFVEMVVTRAAESTRSLVEDDNWGVVGDVAMMIIEELLCSLKWQENLSKFLLHTMSLPSL